MARLRHGPGGKGSLADCGAGGSGEEKAGKSFTRCPGYSLSLSLYLSSLFLHLSFPCSLSLSPEKSNPPATPTEADSVHWRLPCDVTSVAATAAAAAAAASASAAPPKLSLPLPLLLPLPLAMAAADAAATAANCHCCCRRCSCCRLFCFAASAMTAHSYHCCSDVAMAAYCCRSRCC